LGEYLYLAPDNAFPAARAAALRALELDSTLAEAHASLGEVKLFYDWNWSESEKDYLAAIEMKPNYATARHWYAWWLLLRRRFDDALENLMEAQSIDPGCLILNTVRGLPFYYRGDYERAIQRFQTTLKMEPHFSQALYYLGSALAQAGRPAEALAQFEKIRSSEYVQQTIAVVGYTYAVSGQIDRALTKLTQLQTLAKKRYVSPYLEAVVHAGLRQKDRALTCLERAFRERACWMVFINVDPFFESLRGEPRFAALVRRMGLEPR
jgi:tetratricopeptide (TPR) repeat protein